MPQRCECPLYLGDYLPWQQMAVARKKKYIRIGTYRNSWYFDVWSVILPDLSENLRSVQEYTGPYTAQYAHISHLHKKTAQTVLNKYVLRTSWDGLFHWRNCYYEILTCILSRSNGLNQNSLNWWTGVMCWCRSDADSILQIIWSWTNLMKNILVQTRVKQ